MPLPLSKLPKTTGVFYLLNELQSLPSNSLTNDLVSVEQPPYVFAPHGVSYLEKLGSMPFKKLVTTLAKGYPGPAMYYLSRLITKLNKGGQMLLASKIIETGEPGYIYAMIEQASWQQETSEIVLERFKAAKASMFKKDLQKLIFVVEKMGLGSFKDEVLAVLTDSDKPTTLPI